MSEPVLDVATSGEIATLTLNRPKAMNALSAELRGEIARAFSELQADPEVTVIILTGAGRAFCAGIDLKELSTESTEGFGDVDMLRQIRAFEGPIIGAINGHAITGGFELALACDVRIASSEARFADTHARVGILPGWGLSQLLPRLVGISRAKEISLTGNFVSAAQAEAWGLVNRVVEPSELLATCRDLAKDMLSCDRASLLGYKRLIDDGARLPLGEALALETRVSREAAASVTSEGIAQRRSGIQARGRSQSSE